MFSSQSQSPVVNNEVAITPGTWEAIMEERRIANPSRLMFPYIPVENIPYPLHRWYRFGREGVPPGFVEGDGTPFFHQPRFEELICRRRAMAEKMQTDTGRPYRVNIENGTIDLRPDACAQVADRQPLKRKRSLSPSPASPSSSRQVSPRSSRSLRNTDCKFPSAENIEYMEYMETRNRLEGGAPNSQSGFGVRLPTLSYERSTAPPERRSRAPCQPPGPGSSHMRSQQHDGSRVRSDSVGNAPASPSGPPKPPVPVYPWK